MSYEIYMAQDGILRISFTGNLDHNEMTSFRKDFDLYLEAATESSPLNLVAHVSQTREISAEARRMFIELNQDNRFGNIACVGDNRPFRVLTKFMGKASQRNNIRSFGQEDEALVWLHKKSTENNHRNPSENPSKGQGI